MRALPALLLLALAPACGDDLHVSPGGDILDQLNSLDGVTATEYTPPSGQGEPGYRYFDVEFTEPIDHANPDAGSFEVYAAIMHKDAATPLVVYNSGYDAGWTRYLTEPAAIFSFNQISLEYRFYGTSKPSGGIPWAQLTIEQNAADQHDILQKLSEIYAGPVITTGGSKGGGQSMEYAKLYPDDVDGVVAYVPPIETGNPDLRFDGIFDRIGLDPCRTNVRTVAHRMLERRDAMDADAAAEQGAAYTVVPLDRAVETAIVELEFSFWMTRGERDCDAVPDAATATDDQLYQFLADTSPPDGYDDESMAVSQMQYTFQVERELGYPIVNHAYLDDLMKYSYEDDTVFLPPGVAITYDPSHLRALAPWIASTETHVMTIDGEWDPWSAAYVTVAPGRDAYQLWTPHGSHWSTGIYSISAADQQTALDAIRRWTGMSSKRAALQLAPPRASMATRGPR